MQPEYEETPVLADDEAAEVQTEQPTENPFATDDEQDSDADVEDEDTEDE